MRISGDMVLGMGGCSCTHTCCGPGQDHKLRPVCLLQLCTHIRVVVFKNYVALMFNCLQAAWALNYVGRVSGTDAHLQAYYSTCCCCLV
jgi:hypothetical protein